MITRLYKLMGSDTVPSLMPVPPKASKLSLHFDPAGLKSDLETLGSGEWVAHFNTGFYSGEWSGVALRASGGNASTMYADMTHDAFADTSLLQQCGHLRKVVETFQCPLRSVRLLRLTAGSVIREHRDYDLGYDAGEVRIHIPVVTNPNVEFYLDNHRIIMGEGECWYLDLNLTHRVHNRGNTDRIHLVIDCQLNDWLRDLVSRGTPEEGVESSFEIFRRLVLEEQALQAALIDIADPKAFTECAMALGRERGFDFMESDIDAALIAARKSWNERWIA